ncbi:MAG: ABC transporter permease, partial [Eubacteriales bacterium]|nr:ABC transporter permease [Eubacteriales bacterium]
MLIELTGESALDTYKVLFEGAFIGKNNLSETLIKSSILLLTGLSYAFVAKVGLINIGAEGQLYIGAACSAAVGIYGTFLPGALHLIAALLAGFVGGMIWGGIVGFFKERFGANEIITSLMMNYIAILVVSYLVHEPMKDMSQTYPYSYRVATSAQLPRILTGTRLHAGLFVALLCLFFYWIYYRYTSSGYRMRVIGQNRLNAEYA